MLKIKNRSLATVLIFALTISALVTGIVPKSFALEESNTDWRHHWANPEINFALESGIVTGDPDGSFRPDSPISRAELAAIVNNVKKFTNSSSVNFKDVPSNSWYAKSIALAVGAGYMEGYSDNTMRPSNPISRQEVASIIFKLNNLSANELPALRFSDFDKFPGWSKGIIGSVVEAGFMSGYSDNTFRPTEMITRAEALVVILRSLKTDEIIGADEELPLAPVVLPIDKGGNNTGGGGNNVGGGGSSGGGGGSSGGGGSGGNNSGGSNSGGGNNNGGGTPVIKVDPNIIWNPRDIVYGTKLTGSQLGATSDVPGTFNYTPNLGTLLNAGSHELKVKFTPNDTTKYNNIQITETITVEKKPITITVHDKDKHIGQDDPELTYSVNGLVESDTLDISLSREEGEDPGKYEIIVELGKNPNYEIDYNYATFTINDTEKIIPQIYWERPDDIVYGTPLDGDQLNATVSDDITGELEYSPDFGDILDAGDNQPLKVTFIPDDSETYETVTAETTINITPATATITVDNASKIFGDEDPPFTGEVDEGDLGTIEYYRIGTDENVGYYEDDIDANYTPNSNYIVTVNKGDFEIIKADTDTMTVSADNVREVYDGNSYGVVASTDVAGATIKYWDGAGYTLDTSPAITNVSDGPLTVKFQATHPGYDDATGEATVTITPATATITVDNASKTSGQMDPQFTGEVTGLIKGGDLGSVTYIRIGTDENAGVYPDVLDASYTANPNYTVTVNKGDFTITAAATMTVSADHVTKVYDGNNYGVVASSNVAGATIMYWNKTTGEYDLDESPTIANVLDGPITVKFQATHPGYDDATGEATVTITPATATITVDNASKTSGQMDPQFTGTVTGLISLGDLGVVTYIRTNSDENIGVYPDVLDARYTANPNYTVTVNKGDFTITAAATDTMTVSAANVTKVYDGNSYGVDASSNVEGATIKYWNKTTGEYDLYESPTIANVSDGTITVEFQATHPGYTTATGSATVTITKRPITIDIQDVEKFIGSIDPEFIYSVTEGEIVVTDKLKLTRASGEELEQYLISAGEGDNPNYAIIHDVAYLTIKEIPADIATIMFTFDDGWKDNLTHALPILKKAGYKGTIYVNSSTVEWPAYPDLIINVDELKTLLGEGWDISNHTTTHKDFERDLYGNAFEIDEYPDYAEYGDNYIEFSTRTDQYALEELREYYLKNQEWIIDEIGPHKGAYQVAFPSGLFSEPLIQTLKSIDVETSRLADNGLWPEGNPLPKVGNPVKDYYKIPTQFVETEFPNQVGGANLVEVKKAIDLAADTKTPLTLMMHRVMPEQIANSPTPWLEELIVNTADFQEIVDYVRNKEISGELVSATVSEWYERQPDSTVSSISISGQNSIPVGSKEWLTAKLEGGNKNVNITWSSSDVAIATVDNWGLVTGKGIGTATITATAEDSLVGTRSSTYEISVTEKIEVVSARPIIPDLNVAPGDDSINLGRVLLTINQISYDPDISTPVVLLKTEAGKEIIAQVNWTTFIKPDGGEITIDTGYRSANDYLWLENEAGNPNKLNDPGVYSIVGEVTIPDGYYYGGELPLTAKIMITVPNPAAKGIMTIFTETAPKLDEMAPGVYLVPKSITKDK